MNYRKRIILLGLADTVLVAVAVLSAFFVRFNLQIGLNNGGLVHYTVFSHIVLILIFFNWFNMYRRMWQYASIGEMVQLVKAVTFTEVSLFLIHTILVGWFPQYMVPRSIYPLAWYFIILATGGSRVAWRMFRDSYLSPGLRTSKRRTLIVGAGSAGVLIAKELRQSVQSELYPVAFIDDDCTKWKLEVMGLVVLGGRDKIPEVVKEYDIEKVIIAIPSASWSEIAKIIDICKNTGANVKILPRYGDLISKKFSINLIREVSIDDLLGRDSVRLDIEVIAEYLTGEVVLITGAGGSIGSELCRQVSAFRPRKLLLLGHGENSIYNIEQELRKNFPNLNPIPIIADIQDKQRLREVFEIFHPSIIFHAAAHKHVPLMEFNPIEAVKNNLLGTKNVADCARIYGASRFVMISTDKAVNPTSIMGTTKRAAEMYIQGLSKNSQTKFTAVRFGNVLGSRGSVIPLFKSQIREGGPVTVTHPEMTRFFMTIPEASQLVIQAGAFARGGEVFILDMGEPIKITDLANDLIRLSGLEPERDIKIMYTGIRPGEKLYEEILTNEEGISTTKHNRIFIGKPGEFSWDELQFMVRKLEKVITNQALNRTEEVMDLLKQIVPTYQKASEKSKAIEYTTAKGSNECEQIPNREIQYGIAEVASGRTENNLNGLANVHQLPRY